MNDKWLAVRRVLIAVFLTPLLISQVALADADPVAMSRLSTRHRVSLRQFLTQPGHAMALTGDGASTSHCQLTLTDTTSGTTASATVDTVCASLKGMKPPPPPDFATAHNIHYHLGSGPKPIIAGTIAAGQRLNASGQYNSLKLPADRRLGTITQLAIWKSMSSGSSDPTSAVTKQSIQSDLLSKSNIDPKSLSQADQQQLASRIDDIFETVDITVKTATEIATKLPKKDDGNTNEGTVVAIPGGGYTVDGGPNGGSNDGQRPGDSTTDGSATDVYVPPGTTFVCDDPKYQDMTVTIGNDVIIGQHTTDSGAKLGILLVRDDNKWIPMQKYTQTKGHGRDFTQVTAQIYKWNPTLQRWDWPGLPRRITFNVQGSSTEPGECMNSGSGTDDDMFLLRNSDGTLTYPEGKEDRCRTATTKKEVLGASTNVFCEDFGGHTKVTATAPDCVQLKTALKDNHATVVECAENLVNLPEDDNNNDIADAYEDMMKDHPDPAQDQESDPNLAFGSDGDGLSAYEEYRGFRCFGVHRRTSWTKKDLFIRNNGFDTSYFAKASGIACHNIDKDEYDENDHTINFNFKSHHLGYPQHGVLIQEEALGPSQYSEQQREFTAEELGKMGRVGACGRTYRKDPSVPPGPPKNTDHIGIETARCAAMGYPMDRVVGHELGHSVGAQHHGAGYGAPVNLDPKEYPSGGLAGKTEAAEFWLNPYPGPSSGDWDCLMRYPPFGSKNCPGIFKPTGDPYEAAVYGSPWETFCTVVNGTGQNANDHQAGDCAPGLGDCQHKMAVNDK